MDNGEAGLSARPVSRRGTMGLPHWTATTDAAGRPGNGSADAAEGPTRRPRFGRASLAAGMVAVLAFPVLAQDGTGPMPENAAVRTYGEGWDCALGYRVDGADCVALVMPENAYPTGRSFGAGWACRRGYEEAGGTECAPMTVPSNGFLDSSGYDWDCDRGYREDRGACVPIVLPENAYLSEIHSGAGWACERGFVATDTACLPIAVPENGYLTNRDYGDAWVCERGYTEVAGRCDPVALPANAFLDADAYGPGWRCARGYAPEGGYCVEIDLPDGAHLDRSGNRWRCEPGFRLVNEECRLGQ